MEQGDDTLHKNNLSDSDVGIGPGVLEREPILEERPLVMDLENPGSVVPIQNLVPPTHGLPLILDGNFFKVIAEDGLKVTGQCTLCPSRIMGLKTTTSNFNTHLKKMHPERHRLYEEYKVERGQTIKKRRTSHEYPAGKLSGTSSKRRSGNTISLISAFYSSGEADGPLPPNESFSENSPQPDTHSLSKRRQSSLGLQNSRPRPTAPKKRLNSLLQQGSVSAASLPPTIKARRKETDDIVFNFIIRSLSPTSLVESPHFISLVSGLCANPRRVMSRKTLESRINMQSLVKKSEIARSIAKTEVVCATVDAWTVSEEPTNTFVALTAHWIGLNLKLQSALLSCRRFQSDLTYDKLVEVLGEVFGTYNIPTDKICCIVTNNASSLLPTRIYQVQHVEEDDEEYSSDPYDYCPSIDTCDTATNEDLSFYNISSIIVNSSKPDDFSTKLPSHYDSPSQTLIGVLATSTFETLSNPDLPSSYIFQSAIAKCQSLWKACSFMEAGKKIHELFGLEILIPNRQNWSSFLEGIDCLLSGRDVLEGIFMFFELHQFEETELEFLEEYVKVMDPMTEALNVLQDVADLHMGSFVPTILTVKEKLEELSLEDLKFTKPLVESLLTGLNGPFLDIITLDEKARPLILASILHPSFKLSWIPEDKVSKLKSWYLDEAEKFRIALEEGITKHPPSPREDNIHETSDSDLFGSTSRKNENGKEEVLTEFFKYLEVPCEAVDAGQLDKFPNVKKLFITFNTAIASSVPVERIISFSEVSFAPSHIILKDDMLENMLLLKCN